MSRRPPRVARAGFVYSAARCIVLFLLRAFERFKVYGLENVPATGGCMVASNHVSFLDPPAIACAIPHRPVRFLGRNTLFRRPLGRWFFTRIRLVPIDRTRGDLRALRQTIEVMKGGDLLGIFPEGTRSPDGQLKRPKNGIGFLIARAGVPVIPAYVDGSYRAFPKHARWVKRGHVRVFFGRPILPPDFPQGSESRETYERIAQTVMSRIAALKPSDKGGVS
jgi:1-acyl-sn-glycerol-3-phosphate acyltransferase